MKKKLLFRSLIGAPIGVLVSLIITIVFRFVWDTENIFLLRTSL